MMRLASHAVVALASLAALTGPSRAGASADERTHASLSLASGASVDVRAVVADVTASPASGDALDVEARFGGPDGAKYGLHVDRSATGVAICVLRLASSARGCDDRDSNERASSSSYSVALDVRVPAGSRFAAQIVSGSIRTRGIARVGALSTIGGAIDSEGGEPERLATIDGAITASLAAAPAAPLAISTVHGSVSLSLPRGDYAIAAKTLGGTIESRPPLLAVSNDIVGKTATATIGRGGASVSFTSIDGSLKVLFR